MPEIVFYLFIGAGVGLLSGLFGIGGGIITIPALVMILQHHPDFHTANIMHIAASTSLIIIAITATASARAYHKRQALVWPLFWKTIPGQCAGLACGTLFAYESSNLLLRNLFAVFLIIVASYLLYSAKRPYSSELKDHLKQPVSEKSQRILLGGGFLVGTLSTMFGVGGGILLVPLFLFLHCTIQEASGTSALCGLVSAIVGTFFLAFLPQPNPTPPYMLGNIYWPGVLLIGIPSYFFAPLGTRLAFYWKPSLLKQLFSMLLLISALNLFQIG
ncbi:MAG: sulfite exporter TauE/SafE family protein [Gammaproteobacteria bacterium]